MLYNTAEAIASETPDPAVAVAMTAAAASLIPVVVIGAGKEMYDKYTKTGTPDLVDFIFTVLGALPVLLTLVAK